MREFHYEAIDKNGRTQAGAESATSAVALSQTLSKRGLRALAIEETSPAPPRSSRPLSPGDLNLLLERLKTVLEAKLPLAQAIHAYAGDAAGTRMGALLEDVAQRLDRGETLSSALEAQGGAVSPVMISMLRAGEQAGSLLTTVYQLNEYARRQVTFRGQLHAALAYPATVSVLCLFIFLFLSAFVAPQMVEIYNALGAPPPWATNVCVAIGRYFGLVILLLIALGAVGVWGALAPGAGALRRLGARLLDSLPLLGGARRGLRVSRFARSLEQMLRSGVHLPDALVLAAATANDPPFENAMANAAQRIENGEPVSRSFEDSRQFRPSFVWLLSQGEQHGSLEKPLGQLADMYEQEAALLAGMAVRISAPLTLAIIAVGVLFTAYSMLIPLFRLAPLVY